ncbi:MAG: hypothetical protein Q8P18_34580 [Pseudomonadota bacterium]|nr:hypothetical protein [Pseudomonadota bacterium]
MPIFALLTPMLGCTTTELSESWRIDRLRVLGVAAEPAEPRPGDRVTFTSLVVSPDVAVASTVWFACLVGGDDFGCSIDESLLDTLDPSGELSPDDLEALYAAGFIGAEPYLPPVWNVPLDALDALAPEDRLEGLTAIVNVTAIPEPSSEGEELDESDLELAYKRVPVSEAVSPNRNPIIAAIALDGVEIPEGTVASIDRGQPYTITVALSDESVETYPFVNKEGVEETRTEEPYLTWYAEAGEFDQTNDLWPYFEAIYYPPDDAAPDAKVWVVVRDRRGGMAWTALALRYR